MAELVLHVPEIDEEGKDYAFPLSRVWLDATLADASLRADPAFGEGSLRVHAQQNGTEYLVTGSLSAHLVTECGRCLGPAPFPVDVEFGTLFVHVGGGSKSKPPKPPRPPKAKARTPIAEDDLDEEEDLQREEFTGHDIVLDDLVREHFVLEVPMQPLCSPECQGIAVPEHVRPPEAEFGSAEGVDPRLAPLKNLRDKVPPKRNRPPNT
jgi:uncharacterized protein